MADDEDLLSVGKIENLIIITKAVTDFGLGDCMFGLYLLKLLV